MHRAIPPDTVAAAMADHIGDLESIADSMDAALSLYENHGPDAVAMIVEQIRVARDGSRSWIGELRQQAKALAETATNAELELIKQSAVTEYAIRRAEQSCAKLAEGIAEFAALNREMAEKDPPTEAGQRIYDQAVPA